MYKAAVFLTLLYFATLASAEATPDSMVYKNGKWPKMELVVCFGDASHFELTDYPRILATQTNPRKLTKDRIGTVPEEYRVAIKTVIEKEFTPERTSIYFSGWKSCDTDATGADVVLFMSHEDYAEGSALGAAAIGQNLDVYTEKNENERKVTDKKAFVYLRHPAARSAQDFGVPNQTNALESLMFNAVHEFGHVVGLGHEHTRIYKGQPDRDCLFTQWSYTDRLHDDFPRGLGQNIEVTGAYDPNSIMNYCWLDAIETITGTSFIQDARLPAYVPKSQLVIEREFTSGDFPVLDRPKKGAAGELPPDSLTLADPTLFTAEPINADQTRYRLNIGLSAGDLHAIRCTYRFAAENPVQSCHWPFPTAP